MKRIIYIIAAAVLVFALNSCDMKIENPSARDFIGTWDLESVEIVSPDGTVTTTPSKTLDYWVIKDGTIAIYEADKLSKEASFAVKDKAIYIDGINSYKIDEMSRKQMILSHDGFGILVSTYKYHYKKR